MVAGRIGRIKDVIDKPWLVMGIGCLECSVASEVLGLFSTVEEAENLADNSDYDSRFRVRVFDLSEYLSRPDVVNA
jgi:hypothetical protein